ncbi:MAG: hypothetical protein HY016_11150 [Nitrosomonadales bacterium]|nr:hypothetical protein [Nitrosomonadales bacterium]
MTPQTLLLRQINPSFIQAGRVTSQAFRPTPKDENLLSVYDGDKIQAQAAWQHYTATLGLRSDGVMGVSLDDCTAEQLTVNADGIPFPEHVSIDFSAFSKSEVEKKAKILTRKAQERGWLYQA